jgi:TolA-binding protein
MTLTVSGSADGDWQAELKQGTTWVARGLPVTASAVSAAAAALHADLSGPVDELIEGARSAKAARVAELEAELEQARKDLAELEQ